MHGKTFGQRMRALRQIQHWKQLEFAAKIKETTGVVVSNSYLSDLENSQDPSKFPAIEVARAIAKTLDCSLDYLCMLTDDDRPLSDVAQAPAYISEEAERVAAALDELPAGMRRIIMAHTDAILQCERDRRRAHSVEFSQLMASVERIVGAASRQLIEAEIRRTISPAAPESAGQSL